MLARPASPVAAGRLRRATLATLTSVVALAAGASAAHAANPPVAPHVINVFPQRDFVMGEGYTPGETVTVEISHGALEAPVGTVQAQVADDGTVEVNHPGGACWNGVTPDIRAGDVARIVDSNGQVDETTTAHVTAGRPVQIGADAVEVHGTAMRADGNPIPLAELEHRLVAPNDLFLATGKRTLRADSTGRASGSLEYTDLATATWTATYTGLDARDVTRALGAQSVGVWVGTNPAAATESTSYEVGAGVVNGPQAPCTAPREVRPPAPGTDAVPPSTPTALTAETTNSNTVTLRWQAATDDVGVVSYGIYRNGVAVANVQNAEGSAPAPSSYADRNVPPGDYTYTVDAQDANENRSAQSGGAAATTTARAAADVPVDEPPANGHIITAFPSRDFVSGEGFAGDEQVDVELVRNGNVVSSSDGLVPDAEGLVEVNHPGGGCWAGTTPEMRAGDVIRYTAYDLATGDVRSIDQITVANVVATKAQQTGPGTIAVHGYAYGHDGRPLPADQLEQRMVASSKDPFAINQRRTIRAPGEGTIAFDTQDNPTGGKWTATYTGLSTADVQRALSVESRAMWLGSNPLAGTDLTIYETNLADPPGPAPAFCSAPLEPADTTPPAAPSVTATVAGTDVDVRWSGSSDDTYVYGYRVLRDGKVIANLGKADRDVVDHTVKPGDHDYTVVAFDSASPRGAGASIVEQLQNGQGKPYGNDSAPSAPASVHILDTTAPSAPSGLTGKALPDDSVQLDWQASSDDVGVAGYAVYRRAAGATAWNAIAAPATPGFKDTTATHGTKYEYTVEARDADGNRSARSDVVTVWAVFDDQPPAAPGAVGADTAPDVHGKDIKVTWQAGSDNVEVTGYAIYRDGVKIADVNGAARSYVDAGRPAGTYAYTVDAVDSAGNHSGKPATVDGVVANDAPDPRHSINVFPARDFVSATGYTGGGSYVVDVFRNDTRVFRSNPTPGADDPKTAAFDGLVEVNHGGGGGCWATTTPDVRPGDVIRVTGPDGVADQTTTAGLTARRPVQTADGTVVVRGTAVGSDGKPLDLGQLEQRLITSSASPFAKNGRRSLLAPGDGTIAYDAPGSTSWTATYTGLSAADVALALGSESRVLWLGRSPLTGNELTTFENGPGVAGGPAAGFCTAPAEGARPAVTVSPASLSFGKFAPGASSDVKPVTLTNTGSAPLKIDAVYVAGADYPRAFTIATSTCAATLAAGASCTVGVRFDAGTALGQRTASLNFADDAANDGFQSVALSAESVQVAPPGALRQTIAVGTSIANPFTVATSTLPVTLSWGASAEPSTAGAPVTYELQESKDGGAYTTVAGGLSTTTATRSLEIRTLANQPKYQYRVRALKGGLASAWVATGQFTVMGIDDGDAVNLKWGGTWSVETDSTSWGGKVHFATTRGAGVKLNRIQFATLGNFAWIGTLGPNMGQAKISVDGGTWQTVDMYAPAAQAKRAAVVWATNGLAAGVQHDIQVELLGTKQNIATGTRVDVDGVIALR